MRKEPPISTSSPRDTTTSRPSARVLSASSTAAALLLTTAAAAAPVRAQRCSSTGASRSPRCPEARSISRLHALRAASHTAATASSASRARPRLVCRTTPVAFTTWRRRGDATALNHLRAPFTTAASLGAAPAPARTAVRQSSSAARSAASTSGRGNSFSSAAPAPRINWSTDGNERNAEGADRAMTANGAAISPPKQLRRLDPRAASESS